MDTLKNLTDTQEDMMYHDCYVINLIHIDIECIQNIQLVVQYFNYDNLRKKQS